MAKDFFYSLGDRKEKRLFTDFQKIFLTKTSKDITIDDVLNMTCISKSTFYNYFIDLPDFINSFIEFHYKTYYTYCFKIIPKHSNSIFATAKAVHNEFSAFLNDNTKIAQSIANFLIGAPSLNKFIYSPNMETFIIDKLTSVSTKTKEGKLTNNLRYIYTLVSTLSTFVIISLQSKINYLLDENPNNRSILLDDFDFRFNLLKEGFDKMFPKK